MADQERCVEQIGTAGYQLAKRKIFGEFGVAEPFPIVDQRAANPEHGAAKTHQRNFCVHQVNHPRRHVGGYLRCWFDAHLR